MPHDFIPTAQPARSLPARPHLDHLKNEARARLNELRSRDPNARLADAQRSVAHSYGFKSWRKLKAFVEAVRDVGQRLVNAVRTQNARTIEEILEAHPDLVDATTDMDERLRPIDTHAMRLIHVAISEGHIDVVRLLIARGANLNVRNADGRLPLHDCYELGRDEIKDLLLAAGATVDVIAATAYGMHDRLHEILRAEPNLANDQSTNLSPLGWCGYGGSATTAQILIEHGAIVDRPPFDALAWQSTCAAGNVAVARVLLDAGANPNWQDENGNTPLHLALQSRMVGDPFEFAQALIERGADLSIRNRAGRTPLDEAVAQANAAVETYFPRRTIGAKQMERTIGLLRSRPTTSNDQPLVDQLMRATEEGRIDELRGLLDANPHLINRPSNDINGQTALHKAAWRNRADCVRLLLNRGADVHVRDRGDNAYALHFAAENADLPIVQMLVEAGSDTVGEGDDHQVGVLGWATCLARFREDVAEYLLAHGARFNIWSAIAVNRADIVRELISRDPGLLSARLSNSDHRRTPLHHAVKMNRPDIVELLLELGADRTAKDALDRSALATATKVTDRRIISALRSGRHQLDFAEALAAEQFEVAERYLAEKPARLQPGGSDDRALAFAVLRQSSAAVRWLIDHGADVNAQVVIWQHAISPLHLAVAEGNVDIVKLLLDAGADRTIRDAEYDATPAGWAHHFGRAEVIKLFE